MPVPPPSSSSSSSCPLPSPDTVALTPGPPYGHSGMVAIIGRANVGKSTLLNAMVQEKVSIVSQVAQTTRNLIRAILTEPRGQLVFLDTPGVHQATHDLGRIMNRTAKTAIEGTDACLLVLDSSLPPRQEDEGWMRKLLKSDLTCVLALNKIDAGTNHEEEYRTLWKQLAEDREEPKNNVEWLRIAALTGTGVEQLLTRLFELAPLGPPLFPDDILTDFPRKLAIADAIREKLFNALHQELPHSIAVRVNSIDEDDSPNGKWLIHADILVNRPTQKGIVIGKKGKLLKKIRGQAEADLSNIYEHKVQIDLWVKIEKDWAKNYWILRELGYV